MSVANTDSNNPHCPNEEGEQGYCTPGLTLSSLANLRHLRRTTCSRRRTSCCLHIINQCLDGRYKFVKGGAHLLLEGAGNFKEELLLADGVRAKEEECALLIESLCPHSVQHKAQHLWAAQQRHAYQVAPIITLPVIASQLRALGRGCSSQLKCTWTEGTSHSSVHSDGALPHRSEHSDNEYSWLRASFHAEVFMAVQSDTGLADSSMHSGRGCSCQSIGIVATQKWFTSPTWVIKRKMQKDQAATDPLAVCAQQSSSILSWRPCIMLLPCNMSH